jgi:very-short-patch-repair endonuclease
MDRSKTRQWRKAPTDAERKLWQHLRLRRLGGCNFRQQRPLGNYIVDFVCLESRMVIEVNGGQHNAQVAYDERRTT